MGLPFRYRFVAIYKDETVFIQNDSDISVQDEKRSSFYDIKHDQLSKFILIPENSPVPTALGNGEFELQHPYYSVNLLNGAFEINGSEFFVNDMPEGLENFRVIYFRKNKLHFDIGYELRRQETVFLLGWQANHPSGKNFQYQIEIW